MQNNFIKEIVTAQPQRCRPAQAPSFVCKRITALSRRARCGIQVLAILIRIFKKSFENSAQSDVVRNVSLIMTCKLQFKMHSLKIAKTWIPQTRAVIMQLFFYRQRTALVRDDSVEAELLQEIVSGGQTGVVNKGCSGSF